MRKNLTEIVFILDRSGSMNGLERDTIGGFNSMIEQQKKAEGEALISTVLFDNVSEVLHDRVNVRDIRPMTDRDYTVRGCTALLDAIGGAIHHIGNVHKYARPEDVPEHTMFVITTDGMENASRRYNSEKVKQMIERQKAKYGWEFLFLGANIDAVETASQFGIGADRAVNYQCDSEGTALNYEVITLPAASGCASVPDALTAVPAKKNAGVNHHPGFKKHLLVLAASTLFVVLVYTLFPVCTQRGTAPDKADCFADHLIGKFPQQAENRFRVTKALLAEEFDSLTKRLIDAKIKEKIAGGLLNELGRSN